MKHPISWYEERLFDLRRSCDSAAEDIARARTRWAWLMARVLFLEDQIKEAKRRGLAEFDADKLLHKRGA